MSSLSRALWMLLLGLTAASVRTANASLPKLDPRPARLQAFFDSYNCRAPRYAQEYLTAADVHGIDYRLLPAISVLESTCGSYQRLNNHWGWDSARSGFPSVTEGIDYVLSRLAKGDDYRDKTLDEKILVYNPYPDYLMEVKRLMRQIEPEHVAQRISRE